MKLYDRHFLSTRVSGNEEALTLMGGDGGEGEGGKGGERGTPQTPCHPAWID